MALHAQAANVLINQCIMRALCAYTCGRPTRLVICIALQMLCGRTSMQHRASDVRPEGTACKLHCLHNFKRQKRNVMCAHGPPDEGPYKGPIRARGTPRGKASDAK